MLADLNIFGVLLDSALATAISAAMVLLLLRRVLVRTGIYKRFWHPPLADLSMFFVLWALLARASASLPLQVLMLLG